MTTGPADGVSIAARLVATLAGSGHTLATAESLTGGLVAAAVTAVAGASTVFRGGVVAYQTELKADLVGVDADLLARDGPVSSAVAAALASGVRDRLGATWGAATTGVAGPDPVGDHPVGTVFVAVAGPAGSRVDTLALTGDREEIRLATVAACLRLVEESVGSVDTGCAAGPHACEDATEPHARI